MSNIEFFTRPQGINIDITHRCPLECPRCQRWTHFGKYGKKVYGHDISLDDIKKLIKFFKSVNFCGQLSDPIHHPKFIEILKILKENDIRANVHTASSYKPMSWYVKAFQAHPTARWIFGIDGLPEESHKYRKNQDGEKLFKVMLESKKHIRPNDIFWQYIIFSYNEHHIEQAKQMAKENGLGFIIVQSSRWLSENDPLIPKSTQYKMKPKRSIRMRNGGAW